MFNPSPYQDPDPSYRGLSKRLTDGVRQKVSDQILAMIQNAYEKQLEEVQVVLSRPERVRLFRQVSNAVLTDVIAKIEGPKSEDN